MKKYEIYGENTKKMKMKMKLLVTFCLCFTLFLAVLMSSTNVSRAIEVSNTDAYQFREGNVEDCVYLSDIDYIRNQTSTAWDKVRYNETSDGGKITIKIENNTFSFEKGIWAHATSQVTYDISAYNYKYFTTFVGLNTSSSKGNGVKYTISTSKDGETWTPQVQDLLKNPGENATFVKIDISGVKYIRLYANDNGANGQDHSVYADAKLVNESASSPFLSVEEYDKIIKEKYGNQKDISGEYEFTLLKRELVKNVGQYSLSTFYNASAENKAVIDWLMNNQDALRYYILGGTPNGGSYYNSLGVLSRLYYNYKEDFNKSKVLNNKWEPSVTDGEVYLKLAISISLTHSQKVGLWMWSTPVENQSEPVRRYAIYKYLYDNEGFKANDKTDMTSWFEALKVEEMRFVVQNMIDDEELLWLNSYVKTRIAANNGNVGSLLTPHPYLAYVWPNYTQDLFFTNDAYFNELFAVNKTSNNVGKELVDENGNSTGKIGLWDSEFVIPGNKEVPEYRIKITKGSTSRKLTKLWMNFRNKFGTGAVCGGISKSGSNIRNVFSIPASVIGQPGHAALLYYSKLADGRGTWGIDNDVSGWTKSEKGERLLLGWGNGSYKNGFYNVVYMQLGQEAINDFDNLVKAEELVKLASVYSGNLAKQEEIYRQALSVQSINFDAWYGLIDVYNKSTTKTEDDYYKLAEELAEGLKNFPLPMYNLTNLIKPKLKSITNDYKFTLLQTRTLTYASNLKTSDEIVSPALTRTEANYLLGKMDKTIATFSFDGKDSGKIVLSSRFDGNGVRWDYSLDGKQTWKEVSFTGEEEHKLQLTPQEIKSITAENDIYVHIVGVNYNEENLYKIDITEGTLPKHNGGDYLFANDLENRVVGVDLTMEWRMNEGDSWVSYETLSPDLTGNKTVQVRVGATGTKLPSPAATFNFTEDNQPSNRKYIPASHLSIKEVSSEATSNAGNASYAIDGNYNTRWHSAWNGSDSKRFITVELDKPVHLSAVEFVPSGGGNGKIYDGTIWGSMDGENWKVISQKTNLTYTNQANTVDQAIANIQTFEMEEPVEVQYVKIVADRTNGNWFTARAFNFYQDISKNPHPTAGIGFSTTEPTNEDVIARLVNPSTTIKITNNDGKDTYTFTKNGEFTFEFVDEATGLTGSAKAKVNWIDKTAPTATIRYSTTSTTSQDVNARLVPSEDVTVITSEDDIEEENKDPNADPYIVTFSKNGEYTFKFKDKAGNIGSAKAVVTWIVKEEQNEPIYTPDDNNNNDKPDNNDNENNNSTTNPSDTNNGNNDNTTNNPSNTNNGNNDNTTNNPSNTNNGSNNNTTNPGNTNNGNNSSATNPGNANNGNNSSTTKPNNTNNGNSGSVTKPNNNVNSSSTTKPSNNGNSNSTAKPGNTNNGSNNGTINGNTNSSNNSGNVNEYVPKDDNLNNTQNEVKYKNYSLGNVKVTIKAEDVKENEELRKSNLTLSDYLKRRFDSESEYFELYLGNNNNDKMTLSNSDVNMTINLDNTKEFLGVYAILEDGSVKTLNYKKLNENTIEVKTNSLGKYVISYKAKEVQSTNNTQKEVKKDTSSKKWLGIISIILLMIAVIIFASVKKIPANKE